MSEPALRERLTSMLGTPVASVQAVAGGDTCDAWRALLPDGEALFVKWPRRPQPGMARAEARGLAWLAEAGPLRIPAPRAFCDDTAAQGLRSHEAVCGLEGQLLIMEWIEQGPPSAHFDELLGRGLASLHGFGSESFGMGSDNFIGSLAQQNTPCASWPEFYGRRRLEPQLRLARDGRRLPAAFLRRASARIERLDELTGPPEAPARLHGDLWSGNCFADAQGTPCLVDPAVYGGHREVDLAMMRLFGGFSARVFAAYDEHFPLAAGSQERVPLYQLYPLLVHLNLFGNAYRDGVMRAFATLL